MRREVHNPGDHGARGKADQVLCGMPLSIQEGVKMEHGKVILETERLLLAELTEQDKDDAIRLYYQVNSLVSRFADLSDSFAATMYEAVWQEMNRDTLNWAIRDRAGTFVGRICMQHMSEPAPELGIDLFEEYRNKGYGPEAITALVPWFKREFDIQRIKLCIGPENAHSLHIFKKIGVVSMGEETYMPQQFIETFHEMFPEADTSGVEAVTVPTFYM